MPTGGAGGTTAIGRMSRWSSFLGPRIALGILASALTGGLVSVSMMETLVPVVEKAVAVGRLLEELLSLLISTSLPMLLSSEVL